MWRNSVNFASCYIKHTSSFSGTKVRRLDMLNKHIKCGVITHSAKETGWQKKQWEGRLRWQESVCEGEEGRKNLKKREGGNIGFFSWNRRVSTPLPTMLKKLPPIIKLRPPPTPILGLTPFLVKISHPRPHPHIPTIFENLIRHPHFMKEAGSDYASSSKLRKHIALNNYKTKTK